MNNQNKLKNPPVIARWIFHTISNSIEKLSIVGDMDEEFNDIAFEKGILAAWFWYTIQICIIIPAFIYNSIYWSIAMFKSNLKITLRNLKNHKIYSVINISGLAVGLACSILVFLFIQFEISTDRFHENQDRLYYVYTKLNYQGGWRPGMGTPPAIGPALRNEFPEIINSARLQNGRQRLAVRYKDRIFPENLHTGDLSILEMFSFPLVQGEISNAVNDPQAIIITEHIAEKYFGNENPIGKVLLIDNRFGFTVAGVLRDMPRNSTIRFELLVPIEFLEKLFNKPEYTRTWFNLSFHTYVQLQDSINPVKFGRKIKNRIMDSNGGQEKVSIHLSKFSKMYLYGFTGSGGALGLLILFSYIALFVLLIACFNYMNLSTARAGNRALEIGMRKIVGALKRDIAKQFFSETLLLSFIALGFAFIIAALLLPLFNELVNRQLALDLTSNYILLGGSLLLALTTGVIAGSYPAIFLASFNPLRIIKGTLSFGSRSSGLRKVLVVMQFSISIFLIICTVIVYRQLEFVNNLNVGFEKEQIVYLHIKGNMKKKYSIMKQEFLSDPNIAGITATQARMTGIYHNGHNWAWEGKKDNTDPLITFLYVDCDFLNTFSIEMNQGEFFTPDLVSGEKKGSNFVVINENLKLMMEKDNPLVNSIFRSNESYNILGVVKDFHYKSMYEHIGPLLIFYGPSRANYMYIKIPALKMEAGLASLEKMFKKINPDFPFEYHFLDEDFERMYNSAKKIALLFQTFSFLAIFISCFGLFGLASFMAAQRTREIGIRKAMGASVANIIIMLLREFVKWIVVANLIACPIAWMFMTLWLQNFVEQTNIHIMVFLVTTSATLTAAVLTVLYHAVKAAQTNPVDALSYE